MNKLTTGEKREKQLRFRYKQLKRLNLLRDKDGQQMSLRQFRRSELNMPITKEVKMKTKKKGTVTRKLHTYMPVKAFVKVGFIKPKRADKLTRHKACHFTGKRYKRKICHFMLVQRQKKVKARRMKENLKITLRKAA